MGMPRRLLSFVIVFVVVAMSVIAHRAIVRVDGGGAAQAALAAASGIRTGDIKKLVRDISANPERLLSAKGMDIKMALREPELVRQDLPTTIWQYRTEACVLDVYFTGKADPLLSPVAHYEIRARGNSLAGNEAACVRSLTRKASRPQMIDVSALYKQI